MTVKKYECRDCGLPLPAEEFSKRELARERPQCVSCWSKQMHECKKKRREAGIPPRKRKKKQKKDNRAYWVIHEAEYHTKNTIRKTCVICDKELLLREFEVKPFERYGRGDVCNGCRDAAVALRHQKAVAHRLASAAIRNGELIRPTKCSKCGGSKGTIHGHHEDYYRPLDLTWLCSRCHRRRHAKLDRIRRRDLREKRERLNNSH